MDCGQRSQKNKPLYNLTKNFRKQSLVVCLLLSACSSSPILDASSTSEPILIAKKLDMTALGFQLTSTGVNEMPSVSPDERQVLFVSSHRRSHHQPQVYIYDLDNLTERRITFQDGACRDAIFAMNGQKIIYSSNTDEIKESPLLFENTETRNSISAASMEMYLSDISGSDIKRLTFRKGFDGGAWQRFDRTNSYVFSLVQEEHMQAWQINIEQMAQIPLMQKKDTSILSLRPSPSLKKWAWIERPSKDNSYIMTSKNSISGDKNQKSPLPEGDYQDLSWLDEDSLLFSAKISSGPNKKDYYQLYTYDLEKNCLESLFDSNSNLKSPQFLRKQQSLVFVSDLSNQWQIYNKALPPPSGQCL